MADKDIFNIDAKVAMVGDITMALRGSGNESSSSSDLNTVVPATGRIPHITVGLHSFGELSDALGLKNFGGDDNDYLTPWNSVGAVGLDGLFVPYTNSTNADSNKFLPHFEVPTVDKIGTSQTLDPFNPFGMLTQRDNPGGELHPFAHTGWFSSGHNISFALCDNPLDPHLTQLYPNEEGRPVDLSFEKDFFSRHRAETSGIRSMALRSPLVLSGWGYDTSGVPVPSTGYNVIHEEAAWNPNLWKTGPVDLRWNDERKVWAAVAGANNGIIVVRSNDNFTIGTANFEGEVTRGGVLDYNAGDTVTGIENTLKDKGNIGDLCFVYVDDQDGTRIQELLRVEC